MTPRKAPKDARATWCMVGGGGGGMGQGTSGGRGSAWCGARMTDERTLPLGVAVDDAMLLGIG